MNSKEIKHSQEVCLYAFGSCEVDQFLVIKKDAEGKEHEYKDATQSKAAIDLTKFIRQHSLSIHSIACGALHTLILTTNGRLFSFGCNDEGALGRQGDEKTPLPIDLPHPIDMISAGDSHSIACNSANSFVYYWGIYRTTSGNMSSEPKRNPERIGQVEFSKKQITKILSGANHTLVLAEGRVYAWGDPETQVLGRMPLARRKIDQALRIEALGLRNVMDVFTGAYHSFCKVAFKTKGETEIVSEIFAWGLNNYGQLGIGNTKNTYTPTLVEAFTGKPVKKITGGEHHTVALLENGEVYSFGRDDDGQLGLGEDFKEEREEEEEKPKKDSKKVVRKGKSSAKSKPAGIEQNAERKEAKDEGEAKKDDDDKMTEERRATSEGEGALIVEEYKAENFSKAFKYVVKPQKIDIEKVKEIYSCSAFNYCMTEDNAAYSWGCGDQFVLGTRDEETEYFPHKINPKQFNEMRVIEFGLGSQHVTFLAVKDPSFGDPKLEENVLKVVEKFSAKKTSSAIRSKSKQPIKKDEAEEIKESKRTKSAEKGTSAKKVVVNRSKKKQEEKKVELKEDEQLKGRSRNSTPSKKEEKLKEKQDREKSQGKRVVNGRKRGAPTSNKELEKEMAEDGEETVKRAKTTKGKKQTGAKR